MGSRDIQRCICLCPPPVGVLETTYFRSLPTGSSTVAAITLNVDYVPPWPEGQKSEVEGYNDRCR
jgi:hypothetical protein